MNKLSEVLEKRLGPLAMKIGNQRHLLAIRNGITLGMPLIIVGSIFLILGNLPITGYSDWLAAHGDLGTWLGKVVDGSFGLMGIIAAFGIAYNYAKGYQVDPASAGIISLSSFFIVTPKMFDADGAAGISYGYLGSKGLFVAIIVALISADIFRRFIQKNITIKMPDTVPPEVSRSFSALIPAAVIITFWALLIKLLELVGIDNIHDIVMLVLGRPLGILGGSLIGTVLGIMLNSLFWFTGIHGGNIIGSILNPIYLINTDANRLALQAGKELPNIITSSFMDNFVYMGGGGATLALVIILVAFAKSKQLKTMGNLSFASGIFNINEPIMFGVPVVMNPTLIIPFALAPMVNAIITYFAMSAGIVSKTVGVAVPWTMPPIISGFLATGGDFKASLLQVVLIAIDFVIYFGFVKTLDKQLFAEEQGTIEG